MEEGDEGDTAILFHDELEHASQEMMQQMEVARECQKERPEDTSAIVALEEEEFLQYWSMSRGEWLPAKLISREGNGVFIIDKQMSGCLAKVHNADLLWNAELHRDHVLRLLGNLEQSREEALPPQSQKNWTWNHRPR